MTHSEMNDDGQRGRKWHSVGGGTTASKGAETNVVTYMFSMVCGSQSASGAALLYSDQHHVKLAVPPWRRREACQFAAAATTRGKQSHVTDADLRSRLGWGFRPESRSRCCRSSCGSQACGAVGPLLGFLLQWPGNIVTWFQQHDITRPQCSI